MENLIRASRVFYGAGIAGIGVQQFIYSGFRPMLLPFWPSSVPGESIWAYIVGAVLILAGICIALTKARTIAICLGIFFFLLFLFFHVYDQLFRNTYGFHLGLWTNGLKELAFAGGAIVVAASYPEEKFLARNKLLFTIGRIFFAIMLIAFGIDHFLYTDFVVPLVPSWIPGALFWTYFGAVALIGAGLSFLLNIKMRLVGILAGIMLLLWFIILHIPRAVAHPEMEKGNEITSVFQALAFSGISFLIALLPGRKTKS
jgi:uncharacterized membrane protein YphA (DoxX/SURF4 family)